MPFSLENLTSSADLDTINRSQTVELLCPGRDIKAKGRDIGIALLGRLSKLEYALGVFNGSGINKTDDNKHKDLAGRMAASAKEGGTFMEESISSLAKPKLLSGLIRSMSMRISKTTSKTLPPLE